jgi:hypothetical protein
LGHAPLRFIVKAQEIVNSNGKRFQHLLLKRIWDMMMMLETVGYERKITVEVSLNTATGLHVDLWLDLG